MKHPYETPADALPVYERAIAAYPHLRWIPDAQNFCRQLTRLVALPTITAAEYTAIAATANGTPWPES